MATHCPSSAPLHETAAAPVPGRDRTTGITHRYCSRQHIRVQADVARGTLSVDVLAPTGCALYPTDSAALEPHKVPQHGAVVMRDGDTLALLPLFPDETALVLRVTRA